MNSIVRSRKFWFALGLIVLAGFAIWEAERASKRRGDLPCYTPGDIGSTQTAKTRPSCQ